MTWTLINCTVQRRLRLATPFLPVQAPILQSVGLKLAWSGWLCVPCSSLSQSFFTTDFPRVSCQCPFFCLCLAIHIFLSLSDLGQRVDFCNFGNECKSRWWISPDEKQTYIWKIWKYFTITHALTGWSRNILCTFCDSDTDFSGHSTTRASAHILVVLIWAITRITALQIAIQM